MSMWRSILIALPITAAIVAGLYLLDVWFHSGAVSECEGRGGVYVESTCFDRDAVIELD